MCKYLKNSKLLLPIADPEIERKYMIKRAREILIASLAILTSRVVHMISILIEGFS